ncbi:MAG: hypothetical protein LWW83_10970 [Azonexaceae bacterium]|nr:hypothetical protein [Azonexaceae bacterium]
MLGNDVGVLSDDCRAIAQFSENGKTYRGVNSGLKRIVCYQIDNGVIDNDKKRCDNALTIPEQKIAYFIELKGEDIKKAAIQIAATINHFGDKLNDYTVNGRIVCSRVPRPDVRASQIVSLERLLASKGGALEKRTRLLEENI